MELKPPWTGPDLSFPAPKVRLCDKLFSKKKQRRSSRFGIRSYSVICQKPKNIKIDLDRQEGWAGPEGQKLPDISGGE